MKYYLLIAGQAYYPDAADGDWIQCFETEQDALEHVKKSNVRDNMYDILGSSYDWYRIVNLKDWIDGKKNENKS